MKNSGTHGGNEATEAIENSPSVDEDGKEDRNANETDGEDGDLDKHSDTSEGNSGNDSDENNEDDSGESSSTESNSATPSRSVKTQQLLEALKEAVRVSAWIGNDDSNEDDKETSDHNIALQQKVTDAIINICMTESATGVRFQPTKWNKRTMVKDVIVGRLDKVPHDRVWEY